MDRTEIEKMTVAVVAVAWFALMPQAGYHNNVDGTAEVPLHIAYMVSHANAWHLAGNLFVLWLLKPRLHLLPSLVIAFVMSFLPVFGPIWPLDGVTMGFSGVIFAILGIKWGMYCGSFVPAGRWYVMEAGKEFAMKILPFALLGLLLPHFNWCLHTYCLLAGFVYGRYR